MIGWNSIYIITLYFLLVSIVILKSGILIITNICDGFEKNNFVMEDYNCTIIVLKQSTMNVPLYVLANVYWRDVDFNKK